MKENKSSKYITAKSLCLQLGQAVRNEPVTADTSLNPDELYRLARFHSIIPLTYYALKKAGYAETFIEKFEKPSKHQMFKQTKMILMQESLSQAFSEAEIPHYILKGTELQQYYPEGMSRISTDTDFYIDEAYSEKAVKIAEDFGFSLKSYKEHSKTYEMIKEPRYNIEIHSLLEYSLTPIENEFPKTLLLNPVKLSDYRYTFNSDDMYLYTFFHMYKHFSQQGAGIKMFLDLYVLSRSVDLDFKSIEERLRAIHLDKFFKQVHRVCLILFENAKSDKNMDLLISRIFNLGAFGLEWEEAIRSDMIRSDNVSEYRREHIAGDLGLGLDSMSQRYPILKTKPKLLPFYYIHRFAKGILTKPKLLFSAIGTQINDNRVLKNQKKVFEVAGLGEFAEDEE